MTNKWVLNIKQRRTRLFKFLCTIPLSWYIYFPINKVQKLHHRFCLTLTIKEAVQGFCGPSANIRQGWKSYLEIFIELYSTKLIKCYYEVVKHLTGGYILLAINLSVFQFDSTFIMILSLYQGFYVKCLPTSQKTFNRSFLHLIFYLCCFLYVCWLCILSMKT